MDGIRTPAFAVCYMRLISGHSLFFYPTDLEMCLRMQQTEVYFLVLVMFCVYVCVFVFSSL